MTASDWWATVKTPVRMAEYPRRPSSRLWSLRKGQREATLDLRTVRAMGAELLFRIDGDLRRSRVYRPGEARTLSRSIFAVRAALQAKGWAA